MSTRANIGFRLKGVDWLMYHHSDGGPDYLGLEIIRFCRRHESEAMRQCVGKLILVEDEVPTEAEIRESASFLEFDDERVQRLLTLRREGKGNNKLTWDNVLSFHSDELECYMAGLPYWQDYSSFIEDSGCEWAYIINLDTEKLEVYTSHYSAPDHKYRSYPKLKPKGRYSGTTYDSDRGRITRGATLLDEIPLKDVRDVPEFALESLANRIDRQH